MQINSTIDGLNNSIINNIESSILNLYKEVLFLESLNTDKQVIANIRNAIKSLNTEITKLRKR